MKFSQKTLFILVFIVFILVSSILPIYSFPGYSIIANTTSHLGAQGSPNAWIMNLTFILLGITSLWIAIQSKIRLYQVVGSMFGLSLLLTGVFKHGALIDGYTTVLLEDQMHSVFATTTGISFVILAFSHGFMSKGKQRWIGIILAIAASLISLGMAMMPPYMGILQRLMFILSFSWLFFYMKPPKDKQYISIQ